MTITGTFYNSDTECEWACQFTTLMQVLLIIGTVNVTFISIGHAETTTKSIFEQFGKVSNLVQQRRLEQEAAVTSAAADEGALARYALTGRILQSNGQPFAGARVEGIMLGVNVVPTALERLRRQRNGQPPQMTIRGMSRSDGGFRLEGLREGFGLLIVFRHEGVPLLAGVTIPTTETVELRFRNENGSIIRGVATDKVTKLPLSGVQIDVLAHRFVGEVQDDGISQAEDYLLRAVCSSARTGSSGDFEFRHVPSGSVSLTAKSPKYYQLPGDPSWQPFRVREGETTTVSSLQLYPGYTIQGRLTDSKTGAPVSSAVVRVTNNAAEAKVSATGLTDNNGSYTLAGVTPVVSRLPEGNMRRGIIALGTHRHGYKKGAQVLEVTMPVDITSLTITQDIKLESDP